MGTGFPYEAFTGEGICQILGFAHGSSLIIFGSNYISIWILDLAHCWEHRCTTGVCWVRCTHCSDYEARGASGNYKARGVSGRKYKARKVIFRILAAVNRFSWISRKEESCWGKSESRQGKLESRWRNQKAVEESGKPLKKAESRWGKSESHWRERKAVEESRKPIGENWISCEENWILGERNLDIGERFHNISERFSSIGDSFPTCDW